MANDKESFAIAGKEVHGDRYAYDHVVYNGQKKKVTIFCNGCKRMFDVAPYDHLKKKSGCKCWCRKVTFDDVKKRCFEAYGDSIELLEFERDNGSTKCLKLRCTSCDRTWHTGLSTPSMKKGCRDCSYAKRTMSFDEIVRRSRAKHGDRYDYLPEGYVNIRSGLKLRCKTCLSTFDITVDSHLKGIGCTTCHRRRKIDDEVFVRRGREVHGEDTFDYSRVNYVGSLVKVTIGCRECGTWFEQTPNHHLNIGNGCPECALTRTTSRQENDWLDSLGIAREDRQIEVRLDRCVYVVDALIGNVVYEYFGSYWHGDPRTTKPDQLIGKNKIRADVLFQRTVERCDNLRSAGFDVKFVWENDFLVGEIFSTDHPQIKEKTKNYERSIEHEQQGSSVIQIDLVSDMTRMSVRVIS